MSKVQRGENIQSVVALEKQAEKLKICEVCKRKVWFSPYYVMEPEDAPPPTRGWNLCKHCFMALRVELRHSALYNPLRVRVAMGMLAAQRSPDAYPTRMHYYVHDRGLVLFIGIVIFLTMIFHLILVVLIPLIH